MLSQKIFAVCLSLTVLLVVHPLLTVNALPAGITTYFEGSACPSGWSELTQARGRLIVCDDGTHLPGLTFGTALSDREVRYHSHTLTASFYFSVHEVSGYAFNDNEDAARQGTHSGAGNAQNSACDLPFVQLLLCSLVSANANPAATGVVAFFPPSISACPVGWASEPLLTGRIVAPSFSRRDMFTSSAASLASGADPTSHAHTYSVSFSPTAYGFLAGESGITDPAMYQSTATASGTTSSSSAGIPYIQLLACRSTSASNKTLVPDRALVFHFCSCPLQWEADHAYGGRLLVGLPSSGNAGAAFGSSTPFPSSSSAVRTHHHSVSGSVYLPSFGVWGLEGFVGVGSYVTASTYTYSGTSADASLSLPYTLLPLCRHITPTISKLSSATRLASRSPSAVPTHTASFQSTASRISSKTVSGTNTRSSTSSHSTSSTCDATRSATNLLTRSWSYSASAEQTASPTSDLTATATYSATRTRSTTGTRDVTLSLTRSWPHSTTSSASGTAAKTAVTTKLSASGSFRSTRTASLWQTPTTAATETRSPSTTLSATATMTTPLTPTLSASHSQHTHATRTLAPTMTISVSTTQFTHATQTLAPTRTRSQSSEATASLSSSVTCATATPTIQPPPSFEASSISAAALVAAEAAATAQWLRGVGPSPADRTAVGSEVLIVRVVGGLVALSNDTCAVGCNITASLGDLVNATLLRCNATHLFVRVFARDALRSLYNKPNKELWLNLSLGQACTFPAPRLLGGLDGAHLSVLVVNDVPAPPVTIAPQAVATTTTTAASLSTVTGLAASPAVAAQASRMALVASLGYCNGEVDLEPDFATSPTGVKLGESAVRAQLGAAVMNTVVLLVAALVHAAVGAGLCPLLNVSLLDGLSRVRFPGLLCVVVFFLLQPTVSCCVTAVQEVGVGAEGSVALVVLLLWSVLVGSAWLLLRSPFRCVRAVRTAVGALCHVRLLCVRQGQVGRQAQRTLCAAVRAVVRGLSQPSVLVGGSGAAVLCGAGRPRWSAAQESSDVQAGCRCWLLVRAVCIWRV